YICKRADTHRHKTVQRSIPWKRILTSKAFLSVLITRLMFSSTWDFIHSKIPAYFQDVLHFAIKDNGLTYSLLYASLSVTTLISGFFADYIIANTGIGKTNVRKIFEAINGLGMSLALVATTYVGCDRFGNVALLVTCMLMMGLGAGGDGPI